MSWSSQIQSFNSINVFFLMHRCVSRLYRLYYTLMVKPNHKIAFTKAEESCSSENPSGDDKKIDC